MSLAVLRKLGLSEGEVRVYETLLQLGSSPLNAIHERVGIERRNIYDILNKLIERGLVTYITENKKRFFQVAHPNKLLAYLNEKQEEIEETKTVLKHELPAIVGAFKQMRPTINAEIFRGAEGLKAVWDEMLKEKELHWIGSGRYMPKQHPAYFASWNRKRINLKIQLYNIFRAELKHEVTPFAFEHCKFLPAEFSGHPTVIQVAGNKVANFLYGEELFVFVIESKELAENYRRYHKYLWENVCKS